MRKRNTLIGYIGKCVLVPFLLWYIFLMLSFIWETYIEDTLWEGDEARKISCCKEYYIEEEYAELWNYMELYDLHGERYDVYWDAIEQRMEEIQALQEEKWDALNSETEGN